MPIKEDAGELLVYIHHKYENDESVNDDLLLNDFKDWEGKRIDKALKHLNDSGLIEITLLLGENKGLQNFVFSKITPKGVNIVENKPEFKKTFNIEVNLLFVKFGWSVSK